MDAVGGFYALHPFWVWLAVAAVFLAVEVSTGTGWLLWPAASAFVVGLIAQFVHPGLVVEVGLFAALTIASTLAAKRYLRPVLEPKNPDLNDPLQRLVGQRGQVLAAFEQGRGRVFVDGKDWAAETDEPAPATGQEVVVTGVDGAVLTVRAIPT
ncbi:NfeD family protein [Caulobacter segnis]|jgi:membrane protein implicated in regulation of membrane protease activity|uniref:NfeD family protein n=1 Tax=Caulobacter segnis TaxID=88688 RepID=UPI001CC13A90|nr:NfeD family protein [Caulobacter segnis]UAL10308.1 NfeD family protein [Caulobacter segnis]